LLCGALPFADAEKIMLGEWKAVEWFSPALCDIFTACFTVKPKDRIGLEELSRCRWCADCAAAAVASLGEAAPAEAGSAGAAAKADPPMENDAAADASGEASVAAAAEASGVEGEVAGPTEAEEAVADSPAGASEGAVVGAAGWEGAADGQAVEASVAAGGGAGFDAPAAAPPPLVDAEEADGYAEAGEADESEAGEEADEPNLSALSVVLEGDKEEEDATPPPTHRAEGAPPAEGSTGRESRQALAEASGSGRALTLSGPAGAGAVSASCVDVYGVPSAAPARLPAPAGAEGGAGEPVDADASVAQDFTEAGGVGAGEEEDHGLSCINGVSTLASDGPKAVPAAPLPKQAGREKPGRPGRSRPASEQTQPSPTRLNRAGVGQAAGGATARQNSHQASASASAVRPSAARLQPPPPKAPMSLSLDEELVGGTNCENTHRSPSPDLRGRQQREGSTARSSGAGAAYAVSPSSYTARHAQRTSRTSQPSSPVRGGWTDRTDTGGIRSAGAGAEPSDTTMACAADGGGLLPQSHSWAEAATARLEVAPPLSPPQTPPSLAALEARQREISVAGPSTNGPRGSRLSAVHAQADNGHPLPKVPAAVASASSETDLAGVPLLGGSAGDFRQGFQQLHQLLNGPQNKTLQVQGSAATDGRASFACAAAHGNGPTRYAPNLVDWEWGDSAEGSAVGNGDRSLSAVVELAMRAVESLGGVGYQLAPSSDRISRQDPEWWEGALSPVETHRQARALPEVPAARGTSASPASADTLPAVSAHRRSGGAAGGVHPQVATPRVAPAVKGKRSYASAPACEATAWEPAAKHHGGSAGGAPTDKARAEQRASAEQSERDGATRKPGQGNEKSTSERDSDRVRTVLPQAAGARSEGGNAAPAAKPAATSQQNLPKVTSSAGTQPQKQVRTRRASAGGYAAGAPAEVEDESQTTEVGRSRRQAPSSPRRVGGAAPAYLSATTGPPVAMLHPTGRVRPSPAAPLSPMGHVGGEARPAQSTRGDPPPRKHEPRPSPNAPHPASLDSAWNGVTRPQPPVGMHGGYGMPLGMMTMPPLGMPRVGMPPPGLVPRGLMPPPHHSMLPPMTMLPPHIVHAMLMQHGMSPWGSPPHPPPAALPAPAARVGHTTKTKKEPVIRMLPQGVKAPAPLEMQMSGMPMYAFGPPPLYTGAPPFMPPGYMHPPAGYPA
jgi:hypothetical protein